MTRLEHETRLRARILELVAEYAEFAHSPREFVPGGSPVPPSGMGGAGKIRKIADCATVEFPEERS